MRIGEVADAAGGNIRTVRRHERRGLLREPSSTSAGSREHDADAVDRIRCFRRSRWRRMGWAAALAAAALWIGGDPTPAGAQGGHGPAFGLATPTGGKGALTYNLTGMALVHDPGGSGFMLRHTWTYSPSHRVQVNLSLPTPVRGHTEPPRTRGGSLMPGFGDLELSAFWRFHLQHLDVGSRFESTVILGGSYPTEEARSGLQVGYGAHGAVVTGYASRTVYAWAGGGIQRYEARAGDRLADVRYATAVLGWRPPLFGHDYPRPDWRIFVEGIVEDVGRSRREGTLDDEPYGRKLLLGPSVLGLHGPWGLSVGALFPVWEKLRNEDAPSERVRLVMNLSFWP